MNCFWALDCFLVTEIVTAVIKAVVPVAETLRNDIAVVAMGTVIIAPLIMVTDMADGTMGTDITMDVNSAAIKAAVEEIKYTRSKEGDIKLTHINHITRDSVDISDALCYNSHLEIHIIG